MRVGHLTCLQNYTDAARADMSDYADLEITITRPRDATAYAASFRLKLPDDARDNAFPSEEALPLDVTAICGRPAAHAEALAHP